MPFAVARMQLEIITLSCQTEKDKYHMISLVFGMLNMAQINLSMKQNKPTDIEIRLMVAKGERERKKDELGIWGW